VRYSLKLSGPFRYLAATLHSIESQRHSHNSELCDLSLWVWRSSAFHGLARTSSVTDGDLLSFYTGTKLYWLATEEQAHE